MITIHQNNLNNLGKGMYRWVEKDGKVIATIHQHAAWPKMPDKWSVNWMTGRVDWHMTLADARDNALKG